MIAWLAMIVATVASTTSGTCKASGHSEKNGLAPAAAVDHDRGLAGIVEQQARQHQPVPGDADRLGAEMAHVGVKRFRAGSAEKNRAEHQKAGEAVAEQIGEAVARIERHQHPRMVHNSAHSEHADGEKPQRHDRPEQLADAVAALRLQRKQADQDHRRQGDDIRRNRRHRGLQAFERAQHRDGRRDGAVAIKERGAENAQAQITATVRRA